MSQPNQPSKIGEFNDDSLRQIAREIVVRRVILRTHWIIYILVNILLFAINYFVDYSYPWHYWPIVGWGVALLIHTFSYITYRKGLIATTSGGLITYHIFIYVLISGLLAFINWFTNTPHGIDWFFWPFGSWSALVLVHLILYLMYRPKTGENANKSWIDRQVEAELKKVKP